MFDLVYCVWSIYNFVKTLLKRMAEKCISTIQETSANNQISTASETISKILATEETTTTTTETEATIENIIKCKNETTDTDSILSIVKEEEEENEGDEEVIDDDDCADDINNDCLMNDSNDIHMMPMKTELAAIMMDSGEETIAMDTDDRDDSTPLSYESDFVVNISPKLESNINNFDCELSNNSNSNNNDNNNRDAINELSSQLTDAYMQQQEQEQEQPEQNQSPRPSSSSFDAFINCNSNDSLLSNKSCRMVSSSSFAIDSHQCSNFGFSHTNVMNKDSTIGGSIDETTTTTTLNESVAAEAAAATTTTNEPQSPISQCTQTTNNLFSSNNNFHNNNGSGNINCFADQGPSTSSKALGNLNSLSSTCQYSTQGNNNNNNKQNNDDDDNDLDGDDRIADVVDNVDDDDDTNNNNNNDDADNADADGDDADDDDDDEDDGIGGCRNIRQSTRNANQPNHRNAAEMLDDDVEMNVDEDDNVQMVSGAYMQNDDENQMLDQFVVESVDLPSASISQSQSSNDQLLISNQPILEENSLNHQLSESGHVDYDDDTWVDCEDSYEMEEICTCQDYSDDDALYCSEDELPSRDVDLSGYTHLDSISGDCILQDGGNSDPTTTPRLYRKRKLTETRSHCGGNGSGDGGIGTTPTSSLTCSGSGGAGGDQTPGNRKRLALDSVLSPKLSICTPATTPTTLSASSITSPTTSATTTTIIQTTTTTPSSTGMHYNLGLGLGLGLSEKRTPRSIIPTRDNPPPELSDWLLQFQRWSHAERLLAVDRLIEHCEPTQVRHMMKVIEPQFQRDFISLLPKELALQVLSYLDPKDLLRAAQTCRSWRFLCDDNLLWKEKCKKTGIVIEPNTDRPKRGRAGNMPPISSPWKAAYMRQHIIELNWRSRPIRCPKILKGHDDHVITCLQFCGNRIVSGSDDNTLKVWSAITGKCLRTLIGHSGGVWSSQMSGNTIISGSTDRTLKVWNADSGKCVHTLYGHTSTVRCMHLHGKKVVSGSRDATLRVWDIAQGKCLHILVGHLAAVRCVQYDGKLVVSGAYDYMVKVWHPERQECLHTLQGHTNRVYSLQFDGIHVVSGSLDTSIRVWDAETGSCKHTLMGHQSLTSGMELRQNILVSGNADSTVKVWDITTGQCLQTLSGGNKHQSAVTCLQFNSRFVVTSSDDGTVKLWDVQTGEFIRNLVSLDSGGSGGVVWRIRANDTKLICAVGSRNGTEETKLMVLDFDVEGACLKCS